MSPAQRDECIRSLELLRQRGRPVVYQDEMIPLDCPSCGKLTFLHERQYRPWRAGRETLAMCLHCHAGFNAAAARFTCVSCTQCGEESGFLPTSLARKFDAEPTYTCHECLGWHEEDDDPGHYPPGSKDRANRETAIVISHEDKTARVGTFNSEHDAEVNEDRPHRRRRRRRCHNCGSDEPPVLTRVISTAGWIVMAVLINFCMPLFWIGLLMKEDKRICPECGTPRGR